MSRKCKIAVRTYPATKVIVLPSGLSWPDCWGQRRFDLGSCGSFLHPLRRSALGARGTRYRV